MRAHAVGTRLRSVLRYASALICATAFALLLVARPAHAATFSDRSPAPGSIVTSDGHVSVNVGFAGGNVQYGMTVDGATIWPWQLNVQRPTPTTLSIRTLQKISFRDGLRTVRVTITDSTGTYVDTWTFNARIKPTLSAPYPSPGSTSGLPRPRIGLRIADDTPGKLRVRLRIGGAQVFDGLADQGDWRFTPASDLANNATHTVIADVTDANGNTSSNTWSFATSAAAAMTVPPTCTGPGCHPTYPAAHPMAGCETCHYARADIRPGPNHDLYYYEDDVGCLDCHNAHVPRDPARWFCETCHSSSAPTVGQHTAANTTDLHLSTTVSCDPCHEDGLLAEHAKYPRDSEFKNQCDTCHASADARVAAAISAGDTDCDACHVVGSSHDAHPARMAPANIPIFENHDGLGPIGAEMDCATCHASADLIVVHGGDCRTCHAEGGPLGSFSSWNGTCRQGECHPTIHSSASTAHTTIAVAGCEEACHDEEDWAVAPSRCGACHAASEGVAPLTTADVKTTYVGAAVIELEATDPRPSSGIHRTYYRIDGGATSEGSLVTVPGPESGSAAHTIQFWTADNAGNVEGAHTASFTIAADTVAPATSSNARSAYVGIADIALTVTDNGSVAVRDTFHRLDGGPQASGRTLSVPGPASGTATHTLEFWSVDAGGMEESPHKSVTFRIDADAEAPTTTSDAPLYDPTHAPLRVAFQASDPAPASGVARTFLRVNGLAPYAGSWYYISNYGVNTIEYWSVDAAGNEEPHKTAQVIKDPWAPVTTSDAKESYVESAVVRLTAGDSGAAGVAATYYTVDGGTQQSGSTVGLASIGTHTVRYWSVDRAGNAEAPKSATFNIASPAPSATPTGTIVMRWDSPPAGSWTYYYVYDSAGGLVASGYNTTGVGTFVVPVRSQAYTVKTYWYDSEGEECRPVWSYGTALVDVAGKTVTWSY